MIGTRERSRGSTLIELVITMAIIGIITAVALPSYTVHVKRGQRAEARSQIAQAAQFMTRFYAANGSYTTARNGDAVTVSMPDRLKQSPAQGIPLYQLDTTNSDLTSPERFKLVFRPVNAISSDKCGSLALDNTGAKGVVDATASRDECWR